MSYQVLARKWRPRNFTEVVGQTHILTALSNGLKGNRLHHAYLFSGTRGVGKTSIARLFAKGLNCINGITAEPCGLCEHCKAIEQGHFVDLIEIDAASRTKVEDTRELLDNVQYKPTQGRYKVYLIDEVHMLSRHSFNALLKTLEEPPEYVKFLLATTDPQKLPITILSRCLQFHLKALETPQIAQHLERILNAEKIPFESTALDCIAKVAQGSIRDSLSLTDQAIAMGNGVVNLDIVNTMLGLLDEDHSVKILYALQQGNGEALIKAVEAVAEQGGDWDQLLNSIAELLHKIALQQLLSQGEIDDRIPLSFLAKHIAPEDVQFFYQIVVSGRKELERSPNRRIGVEMVLLRALAFHPKLIAQPQIVERIKTVGDESAEQEQLNSIELPTLSQNSQVRLTRSQTQQLKSDQQPISISNITADALDALEQLSRPITAVKESAVEKKNIYLSPIESSENIVLPVADKKSKFSSKHKQVIVEPSPKQLNTIATDNDFISSSDDNSDEEQLQINGNEANLAESYRWTWSDPNKAKEPKTIRPSDIKQAILQNTTKELENRILTVARQRDQWTDLIEKTSISGLIKEMAINSVLLELQDQKLTLGLRSPSLHLKDEKSVNLLAQAITQVYGKSINLQIDEYNELDRLTPAELRKQIYQEFTEQAKRDLQQDSKIKLLQKNFGATLDLESIRPV
ncbi:DNA polymerase III subunit gamma/tau [Seminibacterium arietis]|uniref:DNA polymerase III subunit gamma/tau n=1 Tax=Seminibacterium arietis TaxID=1173502 RepID=A0ABW3I6T2_9PAST